MEEPAVPSSGWRQGKRGIRLRGPVFRELEEAAGIRRVAKRCWGRDGLEVACIVDRQRMQAAVLERSAESCRVRRFATRQTRAAHVQWGRRNTVSHRISRCELVPASL